MADVAVLGPVPSAAALAADRSCGVGASAIGSDVFTIGYPAEDRVRTLSRR